MGDIKCFVTEGNISHHSKNIFGSDKPKENIFVKKCIFFYSFYKMTQRKDLNKMCECRNMSQKIALNIFSEVHI